MNRTIFKEQVAVFTSIAVMFALIVSMMPLSVTAESDDVEDFYTDSSVAIVEVGIDDESLEGIDGSPEITAPAPTPVQEILSQCFDGVNLIENGSFETPEVTNSSNWQNFSSVDGWTLSAGLELQRGWQGNEAAHGEQYAELAAEKLVTISQNVTLEEGAEYTIFWKFAPRQTTSAGQNLLTVAVDGEVVATSGPQAGTEALTAGDWIAEEVSFVATGTSVDVAFAGIGSNPSIGTFLDDVVVCKTAEPEAEVELVFHKLVCESADLLPGGDISLPITAETATTYAAETDGCELVSDWGFQWIFGNVTSASTDQMAQFIEGWNTATTTETGSVSVTISESELKDNRISLRESFQEGYIPFTRHGGFPEEQASAEFYCHNDGQNFDNMEWLTVSPGNTYHCVAWNVPEEIEPPVVEKDTITVCKLDTDENPVPDWEMTITKNEGLPPFIIKRSLGEEFAVKDADDFVSGLPIMDLETETQTDVTGEEGCVTFEVEMGSSWTVSEEQRENSTFVSVEVAGPNSNTVEETCTINHSASEMLLSLGISPEAVAPTSYSCTFINEFTIDEDSSGSGSDEEEEDTASNTPVQSGNAANAAGAQGQVLGAATSAPEGQVLGAATSQCGMLLNTYMRQSKENNPFEVMLLQAFLTGQGFFTPMTGTFGNTTDAMVHAFQMEHKEDVLQPWIEAGFMSETTSTGYVYRTTRWKINNIVCPGSEAMPSLSN